MCRRVDGVVANVPLEGTVCHQNPTRAAAAELYPCTLAWAASARCEAQLELVVSE